MCDPVLIAAILEELGYFDGKKEKDKKDEAAEEGKKCDSSKIPRKKINDSKVLSIVDLTPSSK